MFVLLSDTADSFNGSACKDSCTRTAQQQNCAVEVAPSFLRHFLQQDHTLFAALAELHVVAGVTAHEFVFQRAICSLAAAAHAMTAHMRSAACSACSSKSWAHVAWCLVQRFEHDSIVVGAGDAGIASWHQLHEALLTALQHGAAQASNNAELADLSAMLAKSATLICSTEPALLDDPRSSF